MVMDKTKILLVGDGNHQFITNYAIWLRKTKNRFQIDILSYTQIKENNRSCYNTIFSITRDVLFEITNKIKGVRRYFRFFQYKKILNILPQYDFIHFHFISVDSYFLVEQFRKIKKTKIILSIWGSDMYRLNPASESKFINTCKKADIITFTNQKTSASFKSKYAWKHDNLDLCRFGLAPLETLKKLLVTKSECKSNLNWNNNKLAITIGYNLDPAQQHLEILEQFENEKIKVFANKILLILPLTYGGSTKYKNQLLDKLNQLPFEYIVYDTFLSDEQVAQIRKASDIMVQLQTTDQFSGSMQEHLFTNNIVITGDWLPYETMKEHGAWFIEINKIEELVFLMPDIIENYKKHEEKTVNNPKAIAELSSWEKNINDWVELYI